MKDCGSTLSTPWTILYWGSAASVIKASSLPNAAIVPSDAERAACAITDPDLAVNSYLSLPASVPKSPLIEKDVIIQSFITIVESELGDWIANVNAKLLSAVGTVSSEPPDAPTIAGVKLEFKVWTPVLSPFNIFSKNISA